ncbi:MAG: ABC transporter ATP-binding protein, partial [Candidatus Hydrothermarchaeota archaeon]|nr:ABC transporter ATP-binding protein [Candidatus Hydrothermarchaeota archaeon]
KINIGEIFCILGPSGSGKTTLLRLLNCLEKPNNGSIYFNGTNLMTARGVELLSIRRKMALVFQEGVVFDASVYDNVAYGLKVRGIGREEIRKKVKEALEIVGLRGYAKRNARTLSGGEKQRVTFAMATVLEPEVLLFDEPTANLDPINEEIINEIMLRINALGITMVFTTHKQEEALSLATRIAVINKGRFEQIGAPEDIFYRPATPFAARFVGAENILEGVVKSSSIAVNGIELKVPGVMARVGETVIICIRPEEILLLRENIPPTRAYPNVVKGRVTRMSPYGKALIRLLLEVDKGLILKADVPRHVVRVMKLEVGKEVKASLKPESCHVIA